MLTLRANSGVWPSLYFVLGKITLISSENEGDGEDKMIIFKFLNKGWNVNFSCKVRLKTKSGIFQFSLADVTVLNGKGCACNLFWKVREVCTMQNKGIS